MQFVKEYHAGTKYKKASVYVRINAMLQFIEKNTFISCYTTFALTSLIQN